MKKYNGPHIVPYHTSISIVNKIQLVKLKVIDFIFIFKNAYKCVHISKILNYHLIQYNSLISFFFIEIMLAMSPFWLSEVLNEMCGCL